jgi:hypothetical protein
MYLSNPATGWTDGPTKNLIFYAEARESERNERDGADYTSELVSEDVRAERGRSPLDKEMTSPGGCLRSTWSSTK